MTAYNDEIDLRPIIQIIISKWWRIALIGLLTAILGLSISLVRPEKYQATATILLTRTRSSLSLADQFPTVNEPVDTRSRMDAILSIARNGNVALQTYLLTKDKLPNKDFREFRGLVEVTSQGDLIIVTATTDDAAVATEIANTWTDLAATAINAAYSGQQFPSEIQNQIIPARQEYLATQSELEKFIQADQSYMLQKQIDEAQTVFDNIIQDRTWYATYLTQRKQNLEQIIIQAEALKNQLDNGKFSSAAEIGDALAVLRARASTFNYVQSQSNSTNAVLNPPNDFQFLDVTSLIDTTTNASKDLENLIKEALVEKQKSEENLQVFYREVIDGNVDPNLTEIVNRMQELQTRLEQQVAHKNELTSKRDSAWNAYNSLSEKETEVKNTYPTSNQVNISNRAITPQVPESRDTLITSITAGFIGVVISGLWYVLAPWIRSIRDLPPDTERENLS